MKLNPSNVGIIKRLLVGRSNRPLRSILAKLKPADIASLFNQLNTREVRQLIDALRSINMAVDALVEVPEQQLPELLRKIDSSQLVALLSEASEENCAFFLSLLSESEQDELFETLPPSKKVKVRNFLNYPEDSAGRMMQTQVLTLTAEMSAQEGLNHLREKAQEQSFYYIYCVSEDNKLEGVLSLRQLATAPSTTKLKDLIKDDVVTVKPTHSSEDVAKIVAHYDFIAIPVVDDNNNLLGIITVDDVLDIIQEQATADIYAAAGLQEDDRVYTPVRTSIKNRIPWMFLNLLLAALASSVVSLFEDTMSHLIILASLKNIVAGMGGNTAIQTLTVVTRGIATGDFSFISYGKAIAKEMTVGVTIGILTGIGAGLLTYFWKGDVMVSIIIFMSMTLNSIVASSFGAITPLVLKKFNQDPATGSGVIVTMATDIFSFFSFLGIAALGLKYFT